MILIGEFRSGVALEKLPETRLEWLSILELSSDEKALCQRLRNRLNSGEASCLAVAAHRSARVLTDDRDARELASQMGIPISGTLGVLVQTIRQERLTLEQADQLLEQMIRLRYRSPIESLRALL